MPPVDWPAEIIGRALLNWVVLLDIGILDGGKTDRNSLNPLNKFCFCQNFSSFSRKLEQEIKPAANNNDNVRR